LSEAADSIGLTRGTLSVYETGHRPPTQDRRDEIVRQLALGIQGEDETSPRFVVAFHLLGTRYLADRRGRICDFGDLDVAARVANTLEGYELDQVVVVPAWQSHRDSLDVPAGFRQIDATENEEIAPVVAECVVALASQGARWLRELKEKVT
jgi:hypothetical protein